MSSINTETDIYQSLGLTREPSEPDNNQLGMEDFMNLMVTELTHQDPFKPMENSELATQISQFAAVSGIEDLNTSFDGFASNMTSSQSLQAASLVGHDVLIPSSTAHLPLGGTIDGKINLPSSASNVTVRIADRSGALVRELNLGMHEAGELAYSWDGSNDLGEFVPEGNYQVSVQANIGGETVDLESLVNARVDSVSLGAPGQPINLNLLGLGAYSFNDVVQIH